MGTPFEFTLAIVVVVMPILLYPILKKYKLSLALGFAVGPLAVVIGGTVWLHLSFLVYIH